MSGVTHTRSVLAAGMTVLVVLLLGIGAFSYLRDGTKMCHLMRPTGERARGDKVDFAQVSDFGDRVQLSLGMAGAAAAAASAPVGVPVTDGRTTWRDQLRYTDEDPALERQLGAAAVLFSFFGLFLLWWGRDLPSLWLGMFCAAYGPTLFTFFGPLPPLAMLLAIVVADLLFALAAYALYAMAEAFARESVPADSVVVRSLGAVRAVVIVGLVVGTIATLLATLDPIIFGDLKSDLLERLSVAGDGFAHIVVRVALPLALIVLAWYYARDPQERRKKLAILMTVGIAMTGVVASIVHELTHHSSVHFEGAWFSLLAIPTGFIIAIPTYKVVEVKVAISRILVVTTMTAIIGAAIAGTELLIEYSVDPMIEHHLAPAANRAARAAASETAERWGVAFKFLVAFAIVMMFGRLHRVLDEGFKRLIFAKRDLAIADLHLFASRRAGNVTARGALLDQAVALIRQALCAAGVAIYERRGAALAVASAQGTWPAEVDLDDPAVVALRSDQERVFLEELRGLPCALGAQGVAFRMTVRGALTGMLAVGPRAQETDGEYEPQELDAVSDVARGVADALFSLRANEIADFVRAVADSRLQGAPAVRRARELVQAAPDDDRPTSTSEPQTGNHPTIRALKH